MKHYVFLILLTAGCLNMFGIKNRGGKESSQFFIDYATGKVSYFSCESFEEMNAISEETLISEIIYENDECGSTVELRVKNALFRNFTMGGDVIHIFDNPNKYYWSVKNGNQPYPTDGKAPYDADYNDVLLPCSVDKFNLCHGATVDDVSIEILEMESVDIGSYELFTYIYDQFDGCPRLEESSAGYTPQKLCIPYWKYNILSVFTYLGQYEAGSWNLRAITRLKYRVNNAVYRPENSSVQNIECDNPLQNEKKYDLSGRELNTPAKGKIYITRGRKIIGR